MNVLIDNARTTLSTCDDPIHKHWLFLAKICSESGRTKLIWILLETTIPLLPFSTGFEAFFDDLGFFLLHFLPVKMFILHLFFDGNLVFNAHKQIQKRFRNSVKIQKNMTILAISVTSFNIDFNTTKYEAFEAS